MPIQTQHQAINSYGLAFLNAHLRPGFAGESAAEFNKAHPKREEGPVHGSKASQLSARRLERHGARMAKAGAPPPPSKAGVALKGKGGLPNVPARFNKSWV